MEALHKGSAKVAPAGVAAEAAGLAAAPAAGGGGVPRAIQYKGVRMNAANRFESSACVESKQLWLGTYRTAESVRSPSPSLLEAAQTLPSLPHACAACRCLPAHSTWDLRQVQSPHSGSAPHLWTAASVLLQGAQAVDLAHVWRLLQSRQPGVRGIKGAIQDPHFNLPHNMYLKVCVPPLLLPLLLHAAAAWVSQLFAMPRTGLWARPGSQQASPPIRHQLRQLTVPCPPVLPRRMPSCCRRWPL